MRIRIDVAGINVVNRSLLRVARNAQNPKPAFAHIADLFALSTLRTFQTRNQGRWAALSPRYAEWKAVHYPGRPLMVRTGALMQDLTSQPFGIDSRTSTTLTMGTDLPYAAFHMTGTRRMPARPPVVLTENAKKEMLRVLHDYVASGGWN